MSIKDERRSVTIRLPNPLYRALRDRQRLSKRQRGLMDTLRMAVQEGLRLNATGVDPVDEDPNQPAMRLQLPRQTMAAIERLSHLSGHSNVKVILGLAQQAVSGRNPS